MRSVGEEGVSETVQDTGHKSLVGCTCQVSAFSLTVTRIPTQARARTLTVHISRSNVSDLVKLLLPLLPNLYTLEVLTEDLKLPSAIFQSVKLPQIRTLVIDAQAYHLMKCCTCVRRLIIHQGRFNIGSLKSIPFAASSLVCLAVYSPVPEVIQGANFFRRCRRAGDSSRG